MGSFPPNRYVQYWPNKKKPYCPSISLAKIVTILICECHFKIIGKFIKNKILKETKILTRLWYAKTFVFGGAAPFNLLRVMRDIGTIPLERKRLPYRHIMSTWTFFLFLQTIFVDNICHWFWSDSSKLQMVAVWATNGIKW